MALSRVHPCRAIGFLWIGLPVLAHAAPSDYEGKAVGAIRFSPASQPLLPAELNRLVGIEVGQPLASARIRLAIQRLHATGRFEEISADAVLENGQVTLTFQTQQNWFITRVAMEGFTEPPNREQLLSATKLELGARYDDEQMVEAIKGLHGVLRANGFHSPRIQPLVERFPEGDELHITFLINSGPRAYFARPIISGDLKRETNLILRDTRWLRWWGLFGWKQLSDARLQRGLDRVRRTYLKHDYLLAKVELKSAEFDRDQNHVRPELRIEAGPKFTVAATGAKLSKGRTREMIPIYQEQSVDQDLLMEGQRNIAQHFQSQGYFDARVNFTRREISADEQRIEFAIDRGRRYKLTHIGISGNRYFDLLTVRERMSILPAHPLRIRNGRFSEDLLARDRSAIEELYRSNGFRDVEVKTRVERDYQGKPREVAVFAEIAEGEQWFVNSLEVSGVDLRLYSYIQSLLTSTEGQPYSAFNVATDRDNILNVYYDNGYPDATMEIASTPASGPRMMDLKYVVNEGRRLYIKDVQVNGLVSTRPSLVLGRISLEQNAPLSLSSMVFSQRRLYDLGIFAKVDVALENPLGNTREKRILYQMEEASRYSFNSGFGAEFGRIGGSRVSLTSPAGGAAFAPRVSLGLSRLNVLGVGHTIGVQARLSTLQRRGLITYLAPQLQGREDFTLTLTGLYDDSRNVRTFRARRLEGSAQFAQRVTRATTVQYRLVFRRVAVSDIQLREDERIPLLVQPVRVGLAAATLIHDKRDDPLNATRGVYYSADLSFANKALASETGFGRILMRNSSYHRVSRDFVLSRNTTFGWIGSSGSKEIPLPERFFAGGAVSHRGFPENQAGPRDILTGFPAGAAALLFNQTEIRFPLAGSNVGGVLFHDAGNVYSNAGSISFRATQRGPADFDYMVHAMGFGVRYRTPIGPVRVDFAYGINSPRFNGFRPPTANSPVEQVEQRVSRFQFHFSLGQAF